LLRRSELAAIEVTNLTPTPDGLRLRIRRSKTDTAAVGAELASRAASARSSSQIGQIGTLSGIPNCQGGLPILRVAARCHRPVRAGDQTRWAIRVSIVLSIYSHRRLT
jgi:hypothetical protein